MNTLLARIKMVIEDRDQQITQLNATVSRLTQELDKSNRDKEAAQPIVAEIEEYMTKFSTPEDDNTDA